MSVLIVSMLAFTVCLVAWAMFGVISIPIKKTLDLNATQFGLPMAMPVLTRSPVRVPLGMWTLVPQVYAAIVLRTALLFWVAGHSDPRHLVDSKIAWQERVQAPRDPGVWKQGQYYSIVFGGYVALLLWRVHCYVGEFGLDVREAALLAALFSLPGGVIAGVVGAKAKQFRLHGPR